ncbi:MAG TPA: periplasmic heavy metal sensor, partial [Casimicrobiaceae bacterium]|nr:periplasmic heavy metal sensor [Casimicrobiaceae bacterium]
MKRKLYALIFAAGFAGIALQAWAQAPGRGMHDPIAVLQRIQAKLNLNTSQQQQWDAAVAQSKTVRDAMRANFQQLKTATQAELAKADPDLAALASLSDQV